MKLSKILLQNGSHIPDTNTRAESEGVTVQTVQSLPRDVCSRESAEPTDCGFSLASAFDYGYWWGWKGCVCMCVLGGGGPNILAMLLVSSL